MSLRASEGNSTHTDAMVRWALLCNVAFSLCCAALMLVDTPSVGAALVGDGAGAVVANVLRVIGAGLILFAGVVAVVATLPQLSLQHVRVISVADFAWVAASAALLLGLPRVLVPGARYIVLGVALLVLGFGVAHRTGVADRIGALIATWRRRSRA